MEELDVEQARRLWNHVNPHLPPLGDDSQALMVLHRARTQSEAMSLRLRAYSHRWLEDRALPSGLPDHLRPKAERMYPKVTSTVGISVNSKYDVVIKEVRGAMEYSVLEAEADGKLEDTPFVRGRMMEARNNAKKKLGL
jgi:hypothetical protein